MDLVAPSTDALSYYDDCTFPTTLLQNEKSKSTTFATGQYKIAFYRGNDRQMNAERLRIRAVYRRVIFKTASRL